MKTGVKSIQLSDFDEIKEEVEQLNWILNEFRHQTPTARIDGCDTLGHPMRMWEWGRVLKEVKDYFGYPFTGITGPSSSAALPRSAGCPSVLDVGSAVSLIGPALSYLGCNVWECDVDGGWQPERLKLKKFLESTSFAGKFNWTQAGFGTLGRCGEHETELQHIMYDIVMSISTIEHVETSLEKIAWKEMYDHLKIGGLMIVTMDCFPEAKKGYMYDSVRWTNYSMETVKARVDELKSYGMEVIGEEDYQYHGNFIEDGSFSWISMRKTK